MSVASSYSSMYLIPKSLYNLMLNRASSTTSKDSLAAAAVNIRQLNNLDVNDGGKVTIRNDDHYKTGGSLPSTSSTSPPQMPTIVSSTSIASSPSQLPPLPPQPSHPPPPSKASSFIQTTTTPTLVYANGGSGIPDSSFVNNTAAVQAINADDANVQTINVETEIPSTETPMNQITNANISIEPTEIATQETQTNPILTQTSETQSGSDIKSNAFTQTDIEKVIPKMQLAIDETMPRIQQAIDQSIPMDVNFPIMKIPFSAELTVASNQEPIISSIQFNAPAAITSSTALPPLSQLPIQLELQHQQQQAILPPSHQLELQHQQQQAILPPTQQLELQQQPTSHQLELQHQQQQALLQPSQQLELQHRQNLAILPPSSQPIQLQYQQQPSTSRQGSTSTALVPISRVLLPTKIGKNKRVKSRAVVRRPPARWYGLGQYPQQNDDVNMPLSIANEPRLALEYKTESKPAAADKNLNVAPTKEKKQPLIKVTTVDDNLIPEIEERPVGLPMIDFRRKDANKKVARIVKYNVKKRKPAKPTIRKRAKRLLDDGEETTSIAKTRIPRKKAYVTW